ncbi:MAG TPA: hypothetical protein VLH10_14825 [Yinghuangia sp.]|uniref:hypothetical protein n=1 Tax=Yinghuangia sp. YIM S10712 TaxID=3436930 RepID=UPI002C7E4E05|nr:hypothetical protein [Yinghuangia sp.]
MKLLSGTVVLSLIGIPLPLHIAIGVWVFFGAIAALIVAGPWIGAAPLRMDSAGVSLPGGLFRARRFIAWSDIEAVVAWQIKDGSHWVGVVATQEYRERNNLSGKRTDFVNNLIGLPVAGTVAQWEGPSAELKELAAALVSTAPGVPFVDPTHREPDAAA